ncbi:MAG: DUF2157 domain-containing protein [Candidatus Brennerbacteria bacterium]|nr:DUF2157 domain-containing protein [Candidatus Brennerbacteria bacterium]
MTDQKVVDYIKTSLATGKPKESIYKELLNSGWTIEAIEKNFQSLNIESEKADTQKRTIKIILTIGAILIGAGIFSFVAANWEEISRVLKVSILIATMLGFYIAGWHLKEKAGLVKTGAAFILLGAITYGASIFLIAQMFNIRSNWPDGFIIWMAGTLLMAFSADIFSLFYLSIITGIIAVAGTPFTLFAPLFGSRSLFSTSSQFLMTPSLLLLAAAAIAFISGWLVRKKIPDELKDYY